KTGRLIRTQRAQLAADGLDSVRIADIAETHWRAIDDALSPIIGRQGVVALYKRSLHLTRARFAWLSDASPSATSSKPFDDLRLAMGRQASDAAGAAQDVLQQTFHDLLTNLIGSSLTERLLGSVWDNLSRGDDAEDNTP
ncbi:MAG: hypothetical protein ABI831_24280, partial [Betaproteobacteria bacterium]